MSKVRSVRWGQIVATSAALLAGCSLIAPKEAPPAPTADPAMSQLADAAHSIEDSWNTIGGIEKARNPEYLKYLDDYGANYPPELAKRVTLNWPGPIEPLLALLARNAGYHFNVVGAKPATPILVFIEAKDMRIGDILRDVGYQVGGRAGVRVMTIPGRHNIELAYVPQQ